ncbi:ENTH domain-containing protein [Entamoeba marina]
MSGFFASARKTLYGLTDAQDFLREATNNEQWGPTSKQQQKIIQYTFHYKECREVMDYLYKRLYEDGKHWREIYKSLLVLDNILKNGSDEAVNIAVSRVVDVKTLQSFQKIDENGKDVGVNVRERSKQILELLTDSDYLKQVRSDTGYGYNSYRSSRYEDSNYSNTTSSYSRETKAESPVKEIDIQSTNDTRYVEQDASPPKAADLLSFDSQHKEPIKKNTSTSLFDMLSEQQPQVQQQTQQVQQKQTKQPDLFDFLSQPSQQPQQQPQQTFQDIYQQPTRTTQPQQQMPTQKPKTNDLFDNLLLPTSSQQTQVQSTPMQTTQVNQTQSDFDFGDFMSSAPSQSKQTNWRANITVDSIEDKRKQPRTSSQHKQTLGQLL